MAKETYDGIPRNKIPWSPKIEYKKCISCGKSAEYCKLGVYEVKQKNSKKKHIVRKPNNCVVFCTGCEEQCPVGAVKFPSERETRKLIIKLQKTLT